MPRRVILVEWMYEATLHALTPRFPNLRDKVESYRGGYSRLERRNVEQRLFQNTNALELGVDIGGIDLMLHCGYPSSYASLLQQAPRRRWWWWWWWWCIVVSSVVRHCCLFQFTMRRTSLATSLFTFSQW